MIFLSHILSIEGISTNPEKVDRVRRLAGSKEYQGIALIPQTGILPPEVYT